MTNTRQPTKQAAADAPVALREARLLTRAEAAAYCRISPQSFSNWIKEGRLPHPLPGTSRWDRKAIDAALDAASGMSNQRSDSALDAWKAKRARAS